MISKTKDETTTADWGGSSTFYLNELEKKKQRIHELEDKVKELENKKQEFDNFDTNTKWLVEPKYVGQDVVLWKKESRCGVHHNNKDVSDKFTKYKSSISLLHNSEFVVDATYMNGIFYLYDIQYLSESTVDFTLSDRKKLLSTLAYNKDIQKTYYIIVSNGEDLQRAVRSVSKVPMTEGVYAKNEMSKHQCKEQVGWYLFANGQTKKLGVKESK